MTGPSARTAPGRATLDSVAALAGVSKQTVSNVLNSPQLVRAETARRVTAAIEQLELPAAPRRPAAAHPPVTGARAPGGDQLRATRCSIGSCMRSPRPRTPWITG